MSTDLLDQLHAVGRLNDEWSEHQLADEPLSAAGRDVSLLPLPTPRSPRRRRISVAAAAAVLLFGGVFAVAAIDRDDALPVSTPTATVALVPDPSVYENATMLRAEEFETLPTPMERVIFAPSESRADRTRWISVTVGDLSHVGSDAVEVTQGSVTAIYEAYEHGPEEFHYYMLSVPIEGRPTDAASTHLNLGSTVEPDLDELLALAEQLDASLPLAGQEPTGWQLVASQDSSTGSHTMRRFLVTTGPRTGIESSQTSGASEGAQWFALVSSPALALETELAGRTVLLEEWDRQTTATWIEAPDLLVQLSVTDGEASSEARLALLEQVIAGSISVDQDGWADFASRAFDPNQEMGRSSSETTTTVPATDHSPDPPSSHHLEGRFPNGPRFRFYVPIGSDQICWRFDGQGDRRCDPEGALGINGENASQPRIALSPDGATTLVYAALPPGATDVQVRAVSQTDRVVSSVIVSQRIWAAEMPAGFGAVDVSYLNASGEVVAEASMG